MSLVMKNFERIIREEVLSLIYGKLDPLQFAYKADKGVNDAKLLFWIKHTSTLRIQIAILDFYSQMFPLLLTKCSHIF